MEYDQIKYQLENSVTIKLLRSRNAPLILSFLSQQFKQKQQITIFESELESKLEDYLECLQEIEPDNYSRNAQEYLEQWCKDNLLRRYHEKNHDDPVFELTPATEKALLWLEDLEQNDFIGTESRFLQIFNLLKEIRDNSTIDVETRISQLEKDRDIIQQEIDKIKETGIVENYNSTRIQERFNEANFITRQLVADFRAIAEKFRELSDKIIQAGVEAKANKGSIIANILDADKELEESDQGKSFYTFLYFLQSRSKQQELEELIQAVYTIEDLSNSGSKYQSLRGIKSILTREANHIMKSNYGLAAQIRQALDESNIQENKRVAELIVEIQSLLLKVADNPPPESDFLVLEGKPELGLIMDRPLHSLQESPSPSFSLDLDNLPEIDIEEDLDEIYHQIYVDEAELRERIKEALINRTEITLAELIELYPVTKGLTEIVVYLDIAEADNKHKINDTKLEEINIDSVELEGKLYLTMPQVIFRQSF